ncbi:ribonucleotide reductase assembly protein NrdI [Companilactobacillus crustorum]|uniref:Ribonucleotide reductase stimulatory protein n=3 Tax=Companilactobacillus TaxID=2767879 RepID=A0A837RES4_9LACO|nr:class Ib ribonucleoside-diphosphate reductase assembly flavoprotein NrdI [Companilactobacillus crustorum]HCD08364.1 class Ib ribonucleoside-diphosphate reductase assembly flavoprotein NrdI [Lactobacillus sp.]APU72475.1 Protein NrdI [Companilactobacillus crustorum]KRK41119.1 ribonucleotide reductase stimulatory protein [Companilactobacillus crustorum JCM 15951]KRO17602.1 ribonucleotide reductase stimulatory protein [Companilactobacillus crustorum]WDT65488.1 class Ib ribonucleoside-diphosphat
MKIAYYSITGQTKRFVNKLGMDGYEITDADPFYKMDQPFVLIVPAYDDDMMDPVIDFLQYEDNAKNCVGVAGGGNRNFNTLYNHTAKDIASALNVPVVFQFEFNGTNKDVENFKKVVNKIGIK